MEVFVYLIAIVFGGLQIILFFKLWGMTNDVRRLVEYFCDNQVPTSQINNENVPITDYDKRLDTVKKGDYVIRISDGKKILVSNIVNDKFVCSENVFSGVETYRKDQVKFID